MTDGQATAAGIAAYGFALQGRFLKRSTHIESAIFALAGTFLVFPSLIEVITTPLIGRAWPYPEPTGVAVLLAGAALQWMRGRTARAIAP